MFYFCFNYFVLWQASISKIYGRQAPTAIQLEGDLLVYPSWWGEADIERGFSKCGRKVTLCKCEIHFTCDVMRFAYLWNDPQFPAGQLISHSALNCHRTHNVWRWAQPVRSACTARPPYRQVWHKDKSAYYVQSDALSAKLSFIASLFSCFGSMNGN